MSNLGLAAALSFQIINLTLGYSPPLEVTQQYAGRALIALLIPLALLICGSYASLAGQPILGSALEEE